MLRCSLVLRVLAVLWPPLAPFLTLRGRKVKIVLPHNGIQRPVQTKKLRFKQHERDSCGVTLSEHLDFLRKAWEVIQHHLLKTNLLFEIWKTFHQVSHILRHILPAQACPSQLSFQGNGKTCMQIQLQLAPMLDLQGNCHLFYGWLMYYRIYMRNHRNTGRDEMTMHKPEAW